MGSIEDFIYDCCALRKKAIEIGLDNLTLEERNKLSWYYHNWLVPHLDSRIERLSKKVKELDEDITNMHEDAAGASL